jgi:hypothetical protein
MHNRHNSPSSANYHALVNVALAYTLGLSAQVVDFSIVTLNSANSNLKTVGILYGLSINATSTLKRKNLFNMLIINKLYTYSILIL